MDAPYVSMQGWGYTLLGIERQQYGCRNPFFFGDENGFFQLFCLFFPENAFKISERILEYLNFEIIYRTQIEPFQQGAFRHIEIVFMDAVLERHRIFNGNDSSYFSDIDKVHRFL